MNQLQDMLDQKTEQIGYMKGRLYLMESLLQSLNDETNEEVKDFIRKFMKVHSDISVEVR